MNRPRQRLWVIAYDIEDDSIRRRIHDLLRNQGERVQYSVFECWLDRAEMRLLRRALAAEIEAGDHIRWYPLCSWCSARIQWQGKGRRAENRGYYLP